MESHPDPSLLDNLRQQNFAEISDRRWSRWNQWTVLLGNSPCLKDQPDAKAKVGTEDLKTLGEALAGGLSPMGSTGQWPYGASYFLKEEVTLFGNGQDLTYLSPSITHASASAMLVATETREHGGCGSSYNVAVLKGLAALYRVRTKADLEHTSKPEPKDPTNEILQFMTAMRRDGLDVVDLNDRQEFLTIFDGLTREVMSHNRAGIISGMPKLDAFIAKEQRLAPRRMESFVWDGSHLHEVLNAADKTP